MLIFDVPPSIYPLPPHCHLHSYPLLWVVCFVSPPFHPPSYSGQKPSIYPTSIDPQLSSSFTLGS